MAWREVRETVSFRQEILSFATKADANIREIGRRFQVSPKTLYKWLKRWRAEGEAGLANRSRRPGRSPAHTDVEVEQRVIAVRLKYRSWGARKIHRLLEVQADLELPAHSTIHRILKRNGHIEPSESAKHQAWHRFEHEAPNQLWQMDFKGWFRTADQERCNPLTVLDDHSRYVVCLEACLNQQAETVRTCLTATFRRYGMPERMTMDNGAPWGYDLEHRYTPLTAWLIRLGVGVSHSRPYHPQTQGKDERFHRTLDVDLLHWHQFRDNTHVQRHFDEYRHVYNRERPHQALQMEVPASRYQISPRTFPENLAPIEYDNGDIVRKVQRKGQFQYAGKTYVVGKAFHGYPIALRPTTQDGLWNVHFCHQKIATIDSRDGTVLGRKPVENEVTEEI